jgi:hypothetical protein
MTLLDGWLKQATRGLSRDSIAQVQIEIREHYELTREAALSGGVSGDESDGLAMGALGDAKIANCQYRRVLLTSAEARLLREGNWEARAVCSRPWLRWLCLAMPVATLAWSATCSVTGAIATAWNLLAGSIALGFVLVPPFLPMYTPARGRVFRFVRWVVLMSTLVFAFQWSWLLIACLWPLGWVECTRISIRRKLPVTQWPKQLYL